MTMSIPDYEPTERRPIASRELRASQAIARWLARRGISPNTISVLGMVASILAGLAFWSTSLSPSTARLAWIVAAALVQLRLLANMFDGMVAIASNKASPVGELYNEVPDRVSDAATFIGLGYSFGGSPAAGYLAALAAVFTAYVRATAKVAGGPQDYCGPMAKPQRIFVVTLCAVYLAMTPQTWQPSWREWGLPAATLLIIFLGALFTSMRRLVRVANLLTR
jgi:phosphatidylglycerophosphate synthase